MSEAALLPLRELLNGLQVRVANREAPLTQ